MCSVLWIDFIEQFSSLHSFMRNVKKVRFQGSLSASPTTTVAGTKKKNILSSVGKQPYSTCLSLFDISLLKMNGCSLISVTVFSCSSFWHCVVALGLTHTDNGASDPLYTARTRWEKLTRRNVESVRIKSSEAFPFPVFSMLEIVPYSNRN